MLVAAVIDTSVWVSALLNPDGYPAQVYRAAREGKFRPLTCVPLLEELTQVLLRPRIARLRGLSYEEIRSYVLGISEITDLVRITGNLVLCRDPNDDIVLETAIAGRAAYVVSRDEDLTRDPELQQHLRSRNIQLVTVKQFLNTLTTGG